MFTTRPIVSRVLQIAALPFILTACGDGPGMTPDPTTGEIGGVVVADGAGVSGAMVALAAGGSRTTNSQGEYRFTAVEPGQHTVTLTAPEGFDLAPGEGASRAVTVTAGQAAEANWLLVGTSPGNGSGAEVVEIRLTAGNRFVPDEVTIDAGTTIRWINEANILHTVTPDDPDQDGAWPAATTSTSGVVLDHTFGVAGETYDYHCEPHRAMGMTGRITVQ